MKINKLSFLYFLAFFAIVSCKDNETEPVADPTQFQATTYATGLINPIGMSVDDKGQLWVAETGLGNNDARVSLIGTDGTVYPVITGLNSLFANGAIEGMCHVLYRDGQLYILNGNAGRLYIADVSSYKPGDPILDLSSLPSEDIATYVRNLNLTDPINSNAYNLIFGPNGDLYIVDAGANAIIKRDKNSKALSLFAKIPNVTPTAEPVPTGIVFDGNNFFVSAFSGFPFTQGVAKIFQISPAGAVSEYRSNFTTISALVLTPRNTLLVTEFAQFSLPNFQPESGRVANEDGTTLLSGLNMPTDIERSGDRTYYVLNYGDGTVQKLTY